jgi:aminoglycoside phosphotransferase (APT) family kinase protein
VHGDLHDAQVLLTDGAITGLLDVDGAGPGLMAEDAGNLVAHLEVLADLHPEVADRALAYADEVATAYAARSVPPTCGARPLARGCRSRPARSGRRTLTGGRRPVAASSGRSRCCRDNEPVPRRGERGTGSSG